MKELARSLRKNQTDAERVMWHHLRNRQMLGCKFRRQQVIGPYIADFLCMEPKIIIEIDGGQHSEQQAYDEQRSLYLQQLGYKVLRFWNNQALQETGAVLEAIRLVVIDLSPQLYVSAMTAKDISPSPAGEGRGEEIQK